MDELKSLGDALRGGLTGGVGVLAARIDEKAAFVCVVTDDLLQRSPLKAGAIVGAVARIVGGGGGGRAHLATAGGKDASRIGEALRQVPEIVRAMLTGRPG